MDFILTLKVDNFFIKLMAFIFLVQNIIGCKFPSMGSLWASSLRVGHDTVHCAPYLQVLLTDAKIKNFHRKVNHE